MLAVVGRDPADEPQAGLVTPVDDRPVWPVRPAELDGLESVGLGGYPSEVRRCLLPGARRLPILLDACGAPLFD